jgi:hypothetical protein
LLKGLRAVQRRLPQIFSISRGRGILVALIIALVVSTFSILCTLLNEGCIVRFNQWLRDSRVGEWVTYLRRMELKSLDMRFLLRGPIRPSGDVVIVAIDEKTIKEENSYPLPRDRYAQLVDHLVAAGVKVIAFDVLFVEPQSKEPADLIERKTAEYRSAHPNASKDDLVLRLLEGQRQDTKLAEAFRRALEKGVYVVTAMHFFTREEADREHIPARPLSEEAYRKLAESSYFRKEFVKPQEDDWLDLFLRRHLSS